MDIPEELDYDLNSDFQIENINIDYRNSNYKFLNIIFPELDGINSSEPKGKIKLRQNFKLNKGGIFWDGSFIITKIMYENFIKNYQTNNLKNINCIELGSGTSLPSIFLGILNKKEKMFDNIVITDLQQNLDLIKENLLINNFSFLNESNSENFTYGVKAKNLDWLKFDAENFEFFDKDLFKNKLDLIICSECIYLEELVDPFIKTMKILSEHSYKNFGEKPNILLSYKIRSPELTEMFLDEFSKIFEYEYIEDEKIAEIYPNPKKLKIIIAKLK